MTGLTARLGPTGIAAIATAVLIVFGLGAVIIPALTGGGETSAPRAAGPPPDVAPPSPVETSSAPAPATEEPAPTTAQPTLVAANFNAGYEDRAVQLINGERRRHRCEALRVDGKLRAAARGHAADMAARDLTGSRGSDGSSPQDRVSAAGFSGGFADELTARGGDAGDVVKHWMHDGDAKDMLLDCDITSIGVGTAMRGRTPYWTLDTGRA